MVDDANKRMNYFDRQFLRAKDFKAEQDYHIDRNRRHNKTLHTPGIAEGLVVIGKPGDSEITVSPGTAIDKEGREIVLQASTKYSFTQAQSGDFHVYIIYNEIESDIKSEGGITGATRITEQPILGCDAVIPTNGINLAQVALNAGKLVSEPNNNGLKAGVTLDSGELTTKYGIRLNSSDNPMITRSFNPFNNSSQYPGLGRWGMFMEPCFLTLGVANIPKDINVRGLKIRAYNEDYKLGNDNTYKDIVTISIPNEYTDRTTKDTDQTKKPAKYFDKPIFELNGNFEFKTNEGCFSVPNVNDSSFKFGRIKENGDKLTWMSFTKDEESSTVKMVLASSLINSNSFSIGYDQPIFGNLQPLTFQFRPLLTVNQSGVTIDGNLSITSGSKPGFVVDYFINITTENMEQGDVVVIGKNPAVEFWAKDNAIPIPEVDYTEVVYDTCVCGIVAEVVTKAELPFAIADLTHESNKKNKKRTLSEHDLTHPLAHLVSMDELEDKSRVPTNQLGKMVTMGAYAFCKVDASYGSIEPGDLLTTSPTRGHAQKVPADQKAQAIGAIVGKALGSLKKGKGKIPVLVMLQ